MRGLRRRNRGRVEIRAAVPLKGIEMSGVSEVSTSSKEHEALSLLRSRESAGQAQTPLSKLKLNEIFEMP